MTIPQISVTTRKPSVSGRVAGLSFTPSARVPEPGQMPREQGVPVTTAMALTQTLGDISGNAANVAIGIYKEQKKLYNVTQLGEAEREMYTRSVLANEEEKLNPKNIEDPFNREESIRDRTNLLIDEMLDKHLKNVDEPTRLEFRNRALELQSKFVVNAIGERTNTLLARSASQVEYLDMSLMDRAGRGDVDPITAYAQYSDVVDKMTGTVYDPAKAMGMKLNFAQRITNQVIENYGARDPVGAIKSLKEEAYEHFSDPALNIDSTRRVQLINKFEATVKNNNGLAITQGRLAEDSEDMQILKMGKAGYLPEVETMVGLLDESGQYVVKQRRAASERAHDTIVEGLIFEKGKDTFTSIQNAIEKNLPLTGKDAASNASARNLIDKTIMKPMRDAMVDTPSHPRDLAMLQDLVMDFAYTYGSSLAITFPPLPQNATLGEQLNRREEIYDLWETPEDSRMWFTNQNSEIIANRIQNIGDPEARNNAINQLATEMGSRKFGGSLAQFGRAGLSESNLILFAGRYEQDWKLMDASDKVENRRKLLKEKPNLANESDRNQYRKVVNEDHYADLRTIHEAKAPLAVDTIIDYAMIGPESTIERRVAGAYNLLYGRYGKVGYVGPSRTTSSQTWVRNKIHVASERFGKDNVVTVELTQDMINDGVEAAMLGKLPTTVAEEVADPLGVGSEFSKFGALDPFRKQDYETYTKTVKKGHYFKLLVEDRDQSKLPNQIAGIWNVNFRAGEGYVLYDENDRPVFNNRNEMFIVPVGRIEALARMRNPQKYTNVLKKAYEELGGKAAVETIETGRGYLQEGFVKTWKSAFPWTK